MKQKHRIIPIFVPHKGCPFDCIYCNQKVISGQTEEMTEEKMRQTIEDHLATLTKDSFVEIAFFGGSFTGIAREQQLMLLRTANEYIDKKAVQQLRLSTRPDYINNEILDYLRTCNVRVIELGVQSLDEEVLAKTCRGHSVADVFNAAGLIRKMGFTLGIQTMIGLPGDTWEKSLKTAHGVVSLMPEMVRIYPTLVIKGTYLESLYLQGKYSPLQIEEAVELCAELLEIYEDRQIKVIRIGLQATENINETMDVVAGPFHPAFRQLVESRRMLRRMEESLMPGGDYQNKEMIIYTSSGNLSNVIGQNRSNVNYIKTKFNPGRLTVKVESSITDGIKVEIAKIE